MAYVKVQKKDLEELVNHAAELTVACRSFNLHNTLFKARDADTGEKLERNPVTNEAGQLQSVSNAIIKFREKYKVRGFSHEYPTRT